MVHQEFKRKTRYGYSSKNEDEEDCALAAQVKKVKGKKFHSKSEAGEDGKECDKSRVKFFHCHKHAHFSTNCPQKKKNKRDGGSATSEALSSQFELEFSLITCMVSSALGYMWYLDSAASFHMKGDKEVFSDLEENDLQMHIRMGDDG